VENARPDIAAPDMRIKVFQKTIKVQQLLPRFASAYAMVNFEEVSVAGFQHVYSDAAWGSRMLVPERRSLAGESAAATAFCHSLGAHTESLQPRVDSSSSSENENEASQTPMPAVTTSASEVYSVFC